jgi:2-hydroxychromene-2-carboxylate isomerase
MKVLDFYFDFACPYAYLMFWRLPSALVQVSHVVRYWPVQQLAIRPHPTHCRVPADTPQYDFACRHVTWLARQMQIPLVMPQKTDWNSLPFLELALTCSFHFAEQVPKGSCNRWTCEQIFSGLWAPSDGVEPDHPARLVVLTNQLAAFCQNNSDMAMAHLESNAKRALQAGVFGLPTVVVDAGLFYGLGSLPMLAAQLRPMDMLNTQAMDQPAIHLSGLPASCNDDLFPLKPF